MARFKTHFNILFLVLISSGVMVVVVLVVVVAVAVAVAARSGRQAGVEPAHHQLIFQNLLH